MKPLLDDLLFILWKVYDTLGGTKQTLVSISISSAALPMICNFQNHKIHKKIFIGQNPQKDLNHAISLLLLLCIFGQFDSVAEDGSNL